MPDFRAARNWKNVRKLEDDFAGRNSFVQRIEQPRTLPRAKVGAHHQCVKTVKSDVAILGGGWGGVSAALALLKQGRSVTLTDPHAWIGGQVTSQALCVLDDLHDPTGECTGVSRSYAEFRTRVRAWYCAHHVLSAVGRAQLYLNPGNSICSHLSAEPQVAHEILQEWLREYAPAPDSLRVLTGYRAARFERKGSTVLAAEVQPLAAGEPVRIEAGFFLDGSDLGESYPLLGIPFRTGSEARAEFNEPHAPETAQPESLQSFTFCLAVEFVSGGDFRISKPDGYERLRDRQPFFLYAPGASPEFQARFFEARRSPEGRYVVPFWFYRSVRDPRNFSEPDLRARAIINVPGNDYHERPYLGRPGEEQVLVEARQLARAYLYWLQHEAPRDDGGFGYPEIRPVPEMTGTADGIAQAPYIREGRRLVACTTVTECDIHSAFWPGSRARPYPDAVGLGGYFIDVHQTSGGSLGLWERPRPYQIPLGALVSPDLDNFAVANKGIGVTQIANGAYRLHPVEWAIGEAAGHLASFMLSAGSMRHPHLSGPPLRRFQRQLVQAGIPIYWYTDVPHDLPGFEAIQMLAVEDIWAGHASHLRCDPFESLVLHRGEFHRALERLPADAATRTLLHDLFMTAHNVRKHDLMHVMDQLRSDRAATHEETR